MHFWKIVVCVSKGKEKIVISDCGSIAAIAPFANLAIAYTNLHLFYLDRERNDFSVFYQHRKEIKPFLI
jgi:hypothetical protein